METKLLTMKEVTEIGIGSKSTIYKLLKNGDFPKPIKYGRYNRWSLSDIQDWIAKNNPNKSIN